MHLSLGQHVVHGQTHLCTSFQLLVASFTDLNCIFVGKRRSVVFALWVSSLRIEVLISFVRLKFSRVLNLKNINRLQSLSKSSLQSTASVLGAAPKTDANVPQPLPGKPSTTWGIPPDFDSHPCANKRQ